MCCIRYGRTNVPNMNDGLMHEQLDAFHVHVLATSKKSSLLLQTRNYCIGSLSLFDGAAGNLLCFFPRAFQLFDPASSFLHLVKKRGITSTLRNFRHGPKGRIGNMVRVVGNPD